MDIWLPFFPVVQSASVLIVPAYSDTIKLRKESKII